MNNSTKFQILLRSRFQGIDQMITEKWLNEVVQRPAGVLAWEKKSSADGVLFSTGTRVDENGLQLFQKCPWHVPAVSILSMTDEDVLVYAQRIQDEVTTWFFKHSLLGGGTGKFEKLKIQRDNGPFRFPNVKPREGVKWVLWWNRNHWVCLIASALEEGDVWCNQPATPIECLSGK